MIGRTNVLTGGGQTPTGTINITQNGQYDISEYAEANIQVVDDKLKLLVQNQLTELVDDTITVIPNYALHYKTALQTVDLPNATSNIGTEAFGYCSELVNVNLPKATSQYYTNYCFRNCTNLKYISLPNVVGIGATYFGYCSKLKVGVFNKLARISGYAFESCFVLNTLILPLRCSTGSDGLSFRNSPYFNSGGTGGIVYTNYENVNWYQNGNGYWNLTSANNQYKSIQENLIELQQIGYNSETGKYDYHIDLTPYYLIVDELPVSDISTTKVYFIETSTAGTYEQHFYNGSEWSADLPNITL